mgnify:CR=1 FL=1
MFLRGLSLSLPVPSAAVRKVVIAVVPKVPPQFSVLPPLAKPEKPLEVLRKEKLSALNAAFASVESGAWVMSSLGFKADANTTANTNIEGLIKSMSALGQETVIFCDYDNVYREVTLEGLQTLQLEVIQNGQSLYAQKWAFRNAINAAKDKDALVAVQVEFSMMDFSA